MTPPTNAANIIHVLERISLTHMGPNVPTWWDIIMDMVPSEWQWWYCQQSQPYLASPTANEEEHRQGLIQAMRREWNIPK